VELEVVGADAPGDPLADEGEGDQPDKKDGDQRPARICTGQEFSNTLRAGLSAVANGATCAVVRKTGGTF